jgi:DNA-binding NarL/FixJ family response regulator
MSLARVILVEDEPFVRTMLSATLAALSIDVVAACAGARDAVASLKSSPVDVAVLDLDLGPGPTGVDVAHAFRERHREIGIIFLTSFSDPRFLDPHSRELPRGSRFLVKAKLDDPAMLRDLIVEVRRDPLKDTRVSRASAGLTPNQIDVLRLVSLGRSNAEIAKEMGVGEKAIERTIGRILEVLEIDRSSGNSRIQLARSYFELSGKALP